MLHYNSCKTFCVAPLKLELDLELGRRMSIHKTSFTNTIPD